MEKRNKKNIFLNGRKGQSMFEMKAEGGSNYRLDSPWENRKWKGV